MDDRLRRECTFMDELVHGGHWLNKHLHRESQYVDDCLHWERWLVDERLCWDVNLWTSVYNTGMMNDKRMGHDVWWFVETTNVWSVWTEWSRNIENQVMCFFFFSFLFLFVSPLFSSIPLRNYVMDFRLSRKKWISDLQLHLRWPVVLVFTFSLVSQDNAVKKNRENDRLLCIL